MQIERDEEDKFIRLGESVPAVCNVGFQKETRNWLKLLVPFSARRCRQYIRTSRQEIETRTAWCLRRPTKLASTRVSRFWHARIRAATSRSVVTFLGTILPKNSVLSKHFSTPHQARSQSKTTQDSSRNEYKKDLVK